MNFDVSTVLVHSFFFAEPCKNVIEYWLDRFKLKLLLEFTASNNVFQELFGKVEEPRIGSLDVILFRMEDILSDWDKAKQVDLRRLDAFAEKVTEHQARTGRKCILVFCPSGVNHGLEEWCKLEEDGYERLASRFCGDSNVVLLNLEKAIRSYQVSAPFSFDSTVPFTQEAYVVLGMVILRSLISLYLPRPKLIVTDCDGTLWNGECGELGPASLSIDSANLYLQRVLREQRKLGTMIAVASKNELASVRAVFDERRDMLLLTSDILSWKVSWSPKPLSIQKLARELGVGFDSILIIDNDPLECAQIESACPGVTTILFDGSCVERTATLEHCWSFDRFGVTTDDLARSEWYQKNDERLRGAQQYSSFESFLENAGLQIRVRRMEVGEIDRVAQLTLRTNQFNSTGRRWSVDELRKLSQSSGQVLVADACDSYGEYGTICAAIATTTQHTLHVQSLVLSCRALGRYVEDALLCNLAMYALESGLKEICIAVQNTGRNHRFLSFVKRIAPFIRLETTENILLDATSVLGGQIRKRFGPVLVEYAEDTNIHENTYPTYSMDLGIAESAECMRLVQSYRSAREIVALLIDGTKRVQTSSAEPYLDEITELWRRTLGIDEIGLDNDFFSLGGDSLQALTMLYEIADLVGREVSVSLLFEPALTLRRISEIISMPVSAEVKK